MTRRHLIPMLSLCAFLLPRVASAQVAPASGYVPPDDTPTIRVGVTIFMNYTFTQQPRITDADGNTVSANSFDVARSYINVTGSINHAIQFRITPDVTRATVAGSNINGSLIFRTKYAYAQLGLDDWTGDWKQTWIRFGIQQTPFIDYEEGIYRYRFQGAVFAERVGRLTSSDAGVSFHTNFPSNYGDVHVGLYNGEGYSAAEVNNQKAIQIRASVRPLATGPFMARGLRLTAFCDGDNYIQGDQRKRFIFQGTYEHPHLNVGADYLTAHDQPTKVAALVPARGFSVWATPVFKQKSNGPELLMRYDSYEPNTGNPAAKQKTTIAGFAYWFPHQGAVVTSLLLDYEQVMFSNFAPAQATQKRIALHGLVIF